MERKKKNKKSKKKRLILFICLFYRPFLLPFFLFFSLARCVRARSLTYSLHVFAFHYFFSLWSLFPWCWRRVVMWKRKKKSAVIRVCPFYLHLSQHWRIGCLPLFFCLRFLSLYIQHISVARRLRILYQYKNKYLTKNPCSLSLESDTVHTSLQCLLRQC